MTQWEFTKVLYTFLSSMFAHGQVASTDPGAWSPSIHPKLLYSLNFELLKVRILQGQGRFPVRTLDPLDNAAPDNHAKVSMSTCTNSVHLRGSLFCCTERPRVRRISNRCLRKRQLTWLNFARLAWIFRSGSQIAVNKIKKEFYAHLQGGSGPKMTKSWSSSKTLCQVSHVRL